MKQTDNFVLRQVADEKILIPCGSMAERMAQVITLSETAAYIYEHVTRAGSMDTFLTEMAKEYQMDDRTQLRQDVQEVLDFMLDKQILVVSDSATGW